LQSLKNISDENIQTQKEFLEAFSNFSRSDREKTLDLLKKIC
jgi:hypothetical protein